MLHNLIRAPNTLWNKHKGLFVLTGLSLMLLIAFLGSLGVNAYTKEADFCASCHIMDDVYREWQHSAHRQFTNCNDCHTDQTNYVLKTWSKATAGTGHLYHNIFGDPNAMLKLKNTATVQENCLRCHGDLVEGNFLMDDECFRCHRTTPHGQ
ncbi:MAG: cytochrome c nitrite reductase small subunit [Clostridia bacterium]|nr:cytochrome c nitrite reductase small subunit [Clostridia bacterium]